ncbi:MAG TPA: hypothetical protein VHE55_16535 [Fimbriimonadaceae bacterium]|nr:hypothetical protein [Fimbriimonadaceae bacterium]
MSLIALALGLAQAQAPTVLHARIISADVFKPGLVVLTREVEVPAGTGMYTLDCLPTPLDGSFWYGSPDMAEVSDVATVIRTEEQSKSFEAKTIGEYLIGNVGKHMVVRTYRGDDLNTLSGTLTDFESGGGNATFKLDSGSIRSLNLNQIVELDPTGLSTSYTRSANAPTLRLEFKASAPKVAHVRFTTLEKGATWNASYRLDLGADNFGRIEGKVQLGLAGLKFENTETKLMAGLPNLPDRTKFDLAAGFGSLESYVNNSPNSFPNARPFVADPYDTFASLAQQARQVLARYLQTGYYGSGFAGGGFGGGGDYSRGAVFAGTTSSEYGNAQSGQLLPNDANIARSESLYAYSIGTTNLEPGDRFTKLLFSQRTPYDTIYRWEAENVNNLVQEFLRVHNVSKTPWTGGLATITKDGVTLAQTDMPFTAGGHDADLKLGSAPDILMDKQVIESKAENLPPDYLHVIHIRITEQTTISATNTKDEPITLEVSLTLPGEITTSGAKIEKLPRRFSDQNASTHLVWTLKLGPGEQKRITVTNVYVR